MQAGYVRDIEYQFAKKNGEIMDVLLSSILERGAAGEMVRSMGVVVDITQRRRAEVALKESEEKYRRNLQTAKEGIWSMDAKFRTTYVNQIMADMLGYTITEMLGQPVTAFMFEEDLGNHEGKMVAASKAWMIFTSVAFAAKTEPSPGP